MVAKLVAAEPNVFATVERMIIVTNDVNFTEDWATTGPWPYDLPAGFTRPISVSIQSYANPAARFTHGMLHQFGLVDLYPHEGVIFPRPYVDEWDNMAGLYNNVHPLVWSKERAGWLTAHGDTINYIPRPAAGASYAGLNPIPHLPQHVAGRPIARRSLSASAKAPPLWRRRTRSTSSRRGSNTAGNFDNACRAAACSIYYVNELIPQGEGPVILRDKNLLTMGLADAFFSVGDVVTHPGHRYHAHGSRPAPAARDFNIQVDYTAPGHRLQRVYHPRRHDQWQFYSYFSPDIWVDSPEERLQSGRWTTAPRSARESRRRRGQSDLCPGAQRRTGHGVRLRRALPDLRALPHRGRRS